MTKKIVNTLSVFISRGAGAGKLYLVNTIFQTLTRTFNLYSATSKKVKVLKIARTSVAAVNIYGTTINTAFGTPTTRGNDILKVSDKMRCKVRLMYSEQEAVIIYEISKISNIRLYQIHCRLCEIFSVSLDISFSELTVTILGDLYQLPPVRRKKVFAPFNNDSMNLFYTWNILVISS